MRKKKELKVTAVFWLLKVNGCYGAILSSKGCHNRGIFGEVVGKVYI